MDEKKYICSGCKEPKSRSDFHEASGRKREVRSRCKACRSKAYFYYLYDSICFQCLKHKPIDKNRICAKCNQESGLKQCSGPCGALLPMLIEFHAGRKKCINCSKAARKLRDSASSGRSG